MAADTKFTESDNPQKRDQAYNDYVKEVTPVHNCFAECIKAFVTGGIICTIGQILIEIYKGIGIEAEQAALGGYDQPVTKE